MPKNFVSFGDAETLMSEVADKIEHLTFVGKQAEWNALTDTEKKKYSVADITDDGDGTPDYYSTTETKTNKIWIDGKPIYRRVYVGKGSIGGQTAASTNLSSVLEDFDLTGDSTTIISAQLIARGVPVACSLNLTSSGVYQASNMYAYSVDVTYMILEYTKTTD